MINIVAIIIKNFIDFFLQVLLFIFSFKTWKKQYYNNDESIKNDFL